MGFMEQQEWMGEGYTQPGSIDEEMSTVSTAAAGVGVVSDVGEQEKGILGPGPADLRLP
jgi:hypothetical protein